MSENSKSAIRRRLREALASMTETDRHAQSVSACSLIAQSPEFVAARVVMLYLPMPYEVETAPLAIRAWQSGKTVVVPKVFWDQHRMMPVEITSLNTDLAVTGPGVREPVTGNLVPVAEIDMVIVPGLGFTDTGYRIGRGMGFYDRFLAQSEFLGISCGLAFDQQIVADIPVLDHDMPLAMLVTGRGIRRFASNCIEQK